MALVAAFAPEQLSRQIRVAIEAGPGFLSVISYWEVMIKSRLGKLDVGEPRLWWSDTLDALQLTPLPFRPEHVDEIRDLGAHHGDPFDRALIAVAIAEELSLLTTDKDIKAYAGDRLRVIL